MYPHRRHRPATWPHLSHGSPPTLCSPSPYCRRRNSLRCPCRNPLHCRCRNSLRCPCLNPLHCPRLNSPLTVPESSPLSVPEFPPLPVPESSALSDEELFSAFSAPCPAAKAPCETSFQQSAAVRVSTMTSAIKPYLFHLCLFMSGPRSHSVSVYVTNQNLRTGLWTHMALVCTPLSGEEFW